MRERFRAVFFVWQPESDCLTEMGRGCIKIKDPPTTRYSFPTKMSYMSIYPLLIFISPHFCTKWVQNPVVSRVKKLHLQGL